MKTLKTLFALFFLTLLFSSCSKSDDSNGEYVLIPKYDTVFNYSKQVAKQKAAISTYIKKKGIKVLKTFPVDSLFKDNEYFLDASGLYIHIDTLGGKRKVRDQETVLLWYKKNGPLPSEELASSNYSSTRPDQFTYLSLYSTTRNAWRAPLKWVGNGGKVDVIAPYTSGSEDDQKYVLAYTYHIEYIFTYLEH